MGLSLPEGAQSVELVHVRKVQIIDGARVVIPPRDRSQEFLEPGRDLEIEVLLDILQVNTRRLLKHVHSHLAQHPLGARAVSGGGNASGS
jgi:hypothetical protein